MPVEFWVDPANQEDEKTPIYEYEKSEIGGSNVPVTKGIIFEGMRVVRGKDWDWPDHQDKGAIGTVTNPNHFDTEGDTWCEVRWDHGHVNSYRIGPKHHDLCIYALQFK